MIRVAAVGDVHVSRERGAFSRDQIERLAQAADVLLLAGDLTQNGYVLEALRLADELSGATIPVVAVLGNHDYHQGEQGQIRAALETAGVIVLEGEGVVLNVRGVSVGVGGGKGFGGGFAGRSAGEFGEPEMKEFVRHTREFSERLHAALTALDEHGADVKIALTHYSPVKDTLAGEPLEIYPFLGSYLMAEAIDRAEADLAVHGHAHRGAEKGMTAGGVRVRNVALPVIRHAYAVYSLDETTLGRPVRSASLSR